jgi:L-ascorbate metabolism protein UlaG (beta-lactamase superfamily)
MDFIQKFGKLPEGARLQKIKASANYKDGAFKNLSHTPDLTEGSTYYSVMKKFLFGKKQRLKPVDAIPSVYTDILYLPAHEDVLVWFGHSSYFMQMDDKKILVDPVLSGAASPMPATTPAFRGTDRYTADDLPDIDYLFISHDHYDHLDHETILQIKPKVICGLGMGAHFEHWGYDTDKISEGDWYQEFDLDYGFVVTITPARHFSGRGLLRNKALWVSFVLQTPNHKIYIGGDSGYDTHFADIGKRFGPFDLAILENGQYDQQWKYIHMQPEEVLMAARDLRAARLFPVHSGKFSLANHPWDEPLKRISALAKSANFPILTPMIGEKVMLNDATQKFSEWWVRVN